MLSSVGDFNYSIRTVLGAAALVLGTWYAALVGIHTRTIPEPSSTFVAGAAALTALIFIGFGLRWYRHPPPERMVDLCVAGIGLTVLSNDALYLFFFPEPQYLDGLAILLIGAGLFLTSSAWYTALGVGVLAVVMATVARGSELSGWSQPIILLVTAGALSTIIHLWRRAYMQHLDVLRLQSEGRAIQLERNVASMTSHQDQLEGLVRERTQDLLRSRDSLRHADKLIAVGTLAAGVAHQINNPVGAILASAEYALLCEHDEDAIEVWKRALTTNVEEARRCAEIVRNILQFARDEPTEKHAEDLNQIVQRAYRATSTYARDRFAKVELVLAEEPLMVRISSIELEQVVVNVLRNAVESRARDAHVELRTESIGDVACMSIRDDGAGIETENLDRIFDPFFSTRVAVGGTGLGLSVAHGIIADHGGTIRLESETGKGTSVWIELPLNERPAPS